MDFVKGDKCDCEGVQMLHKWYEGDTSVTRVLHEVCERVGWMPWKFVWWWSVVGVKTGGWGAWTAKAGHDCHSLAVVGGQYLK